MHRPLEVAWTVNFIIDKNLHVLQRLADRHYVIEKGRTVWSGTSAEMDRDRELVHRYVGL